MGKKYLTAKTTACLTQELNVDKPKSVTDAADQLVLEIKAMVLLSDSQQTLRKVVQDKVMSSHDEDITRFLGVIQDKHKTSQLGYFAMALGELILAAFLLIAGLATVVPSLLGVNSPTQLANYFGGIISAISSSGLSNSTLALLNFVFAIALLLAGFYSLKVASSNLKEVGVVSGTQLH